MSKETSQQPEVKILRGFSWHGADVRDLVRGDIFKRPNMPGCYEAYDDAQYTIEGWTVSAAWYKNKGEQDD